VPKSCDQKSRAVSNLHRLSIPWLSWAHCDEHDEHICDRNIVGAPNRNVDDVDDNYLGYDFHWNSANLDFIDTRIMWLGSDDDAAFVGVQRCHISVASPRLQPQARQKRKVIWINDGVIEGVPLGFARRDAIHLTERFVPGASVWNSSGHAPVSWIPSRVLPARGSPAETRD